MLDIQQLLKELHEIAQRPSILRLSISDLRESFIKARLYFMEELFVQVYRNEIYDSTSFVLILENQRIYARDKFRGKWHRHPTENPTQHNFSPNGIGEVTLSEFMDETEEIIANMELL